MKVMKKPEPVLAVVALAFAVALWWYVKSGGAT